MIEPLSKSQVLLVALMQIGGSIAAVDTEDVAMAVNKLAPLRFAWRKYPEMIDLQKVRQGLFSLRAANLVAGSEQKGWCLTSVGLGEAASVVAVEMRLDKRPRASSREERWRANERSRLLTTDGYKKFTAGEEVTKTDTDDVYRVDDYVSPLLRKQKIETLRNHFIDDPDIGPFLTFIAERDRKTA
ncbi:MAG: hypothetical protein ABL949_06700 [Fimbriimonadaceae bacterium]